MPRPKGTCVYCGTFGSLGVGDPNCNEVVPMEAPEVHILIKQSWQLFGTFTFRQEEMSTGRRFNMFFAWLRNFGTLDNDYGHSDKNWPAAKILTSSDLLKPADVKRSFNKISI